MIVTDSPTFGCHQIPWDGNDAYNKNLTVQMGRCPVRSVAEKALAILKKNQHKLG